MAYRGREGSISALIATVVFVAVVIIAVIALNVFVIPETVHTEEYQWITSDEAAEQGMLDGSFYEGEKNASGVLSYKIAEIINIDPQGYGDFKIENSGKNTCLMKVTIKVGEETVYQTDYLKPNQHITSDKLDKILASGVYAADVTFEGFDPTTEESIGSTSTQVSLNIS